MKKIIFTVIILLSLCSINMEAQSYRHNKQNYDHRLYVRQKGDLNPFVSGVASFFIPGLGQTISGEFGRGLAFFGSTSVALVVGLGATTAASFNANNRVAILGSTLLMTSAGLYLWSIVDAVRVAKVNNMYYQDMRGNLNPIKIELNPYIDTNNYVGQMQHSAGLSLKLSF